MRGLMLIVLCLFALSGSVRGSDLPGLRFLKVSAVDQAVVVKSVDGELRRLSVGDQVDNERRIVAIEEQQVILEGPGKWAPIRYLVNVSAGQNRVTRLERKPIEKLQLTWGEVALPK